MRIIHMKTVLVTFLVLLFTMSQAQTIVRADLDSSVTPVKLYLEIEHPSLDLIGGAHIDISDSGNTQVYVLNFSGCEDGPLITFDTSFDVAQAYPFALRVNTLRFPIEGCEYPDEIVFTDSLHRVPSVLGINQELHQSISITISPNPVENYLNLKLSGDAILKEVLILDNLGTLVMRSSIKSLDITSMPSGVYYAKIITDKGNRTLKFIKR